MEASHLRNNEMVPWGNAYPEYSEGQLIDKALAGVRYREGLTQTQLSEMTRIPQRHISEMEHGKRPIGKEMAKRLGKALNISYKVFYRSFAEIKRNNISVKIYEVISSSPRTFF
jgi:transcriptional regulator with XRE-family HTH domain